MSLSSWNSKNMMKYYILVHMHHSYVRTDIHSHGGGNTLGPDSKDHQRITKDTQTGRNREYNLTVSGIIQEGGSPGESANEGRWTSLLQILSQQDMEIITILYNTQTPQVSKSNNQSEKKIF